MAVHLTAEQARQLGADVKVRKRSPRTTAPGPYATACHDCNELFYTRAAEDRHFEATRHPRYELVLE